MVITGSNIILILLQGHPHLKSSPLSIHLAKSLPTRVLSLLSITDKWEILDRHCKPEEMTTIYMKLDQVCINSSEAKISHKADNILLKINFQITNMLTVIV